MTISWTPHAAVLRIVPGHDDVKAAAALGHLVRHGYTPVLSSDSASGGHTKWSSLYFIRPQGGDGLPEQARAHDGKPLIPGIAIVGVPVEGPLVEGPLAGVEPGDAT